MPLQYDSCLARLLFAQLYQSVLSESERTLTEVEETRAIIREGLNAVMETSTIYYPPFIGSLQVIFLYNAHSHLPFQTGPVLQREWFDP